MTENLTPDKTRSTSTRPPSKALSTDPGAAPEAPAAPEPAPEPAIDPATCFPGYIRKLGGFGAVLEAIDTARKAKRLPSLNLTDYRFVLKRPGGIPLGFPVQVIYKPGTPKEKDLGTFRIGR